MQRYLLCCGYAGSSFEVKTETDSEDVLEYLLSMTLNTSHVHTSTWRCEAVCLLWMSKVFHQLLYDISQTGNCFAVIYETIVVTHFKWNWELTMFSVCSVCLCITLVSVCYQFTVYGCIHAAVLSHNMWLCTISVQIMYQQVYFYFVVWRCFTRSHCNMWKKLCSWLVPGDDEMFYLTTSNALISVFVNTWTLLCFIIDISVVKWFINWLVFSYPSMSVCYRWMFDKYMY